MCFNTRQSKRQEQLEKRFNAKMSKLKQYNISIQFNGFQHPLTPVIANTEADTIQLFNWGLIPHWAKDDTIRKHTLNARIETINQKPSFRDASKNRCLVLIDGFYEWQWLDPKGKNKQKYLITRPDDEAFALAGLWNQWTDKTTGEILNTYTILTKEANKLMAEIHNSQKRMPVVLSQKNEMDWLTGKEVSTEDIELIATML
ncbi:MAG: SOS response-associated peptidase [Bacteroidota bacterium]